MKAKVKFKPRVNESQQAPLPAQWVSLGDKHKMNEEDISREREKGMNLLGLGVILVRLCVSLVQEGEVETQLVLQTCQSKCHHHYYFCHLHPLFFNFLFSVVKKEAGPRVSVVFFYLQKNAKRCFVEKGTGFFFFFFLAIQSLLLEKPYYSLQILKLC
jgi:hypothetical protein